MTAGPRPDPRLVWVDVAVKVATVGLLVWAVLSPDLPQFHGKAFTGRALGYPLALLVVPVAWWVLGRPRGIAFPVLVDILLGLPFLIDVAGNALDLYDTVEWWDDANHLVNWFLHTAGVTVLLGLGGWGRWTRVGLAVAWAASTAILWEAVEYVAFVQNSPEAATAYGDTIGDLVLGLLGGTLAGILVSGFRSERRLLERPGGSD